jgi:hypothetical protein
MILRIERLAIELPAPANPLTSPIGRDGIDKGMLQEIATRLFGTS